MMDGTRELDLVKRAQTGDRDSYGRLVDLYGGVVLAIAYSRVGNYAVSQDIAQDAFLLGFEKLATLRQPRRFGTWLKTITRNLCKNWHKSQTYRQRLREDSEEVRQRLGYADAPGIEEKMDQKEICNVVDEALRNLSVPDRESIILYYFEDKSIAEAAKALDISSAAMRKRLERARGRLRDELNAHVETGLLEAAKKRKMSHRILAAIPIGASWAKIAPVASVLPSAPGLPLTGLLTKTGGVVMGINKTAAVVVGVCAALAVTAGGLYIARKSGPVEEPPPPIELAQPRPADEEPPQLSEPPEAEPPEPAAQEPAAETEPVPDSEEPVAIAPADKLDGSVLYGTVTAPDGSVARGVTVTLERTDGAQGREDSGKVDAQTTTRPDGSYRFGSLSEGSYAVFAISASASGFATATLHSETSNETRLDIQMNPSYATSGTVRNADREPIAGATVTLLGLKDAPYNSGIFKSMAVRTDEAGAYVLGYLWEGSYAVEASADGYAPSVLNGVKAGTTDNDFVLHAAASVSGVVVNTAGDYLPGAQVTMQVDGPGRPPSGVADEEGRFEISDVAPGSYSFGVTYHGLYRRPLNDPLTLEAGDEITDLAVVVELGEGRVAGYAINEEGDGIPGVGVLAFNLEGSTSTTTDEAGHYLLDGLSESAMRMTFQHDEYAKANLTDVPLGTTDANVVMLRYGSIAGLVLDGATLEPIGDSTIKVIESFQNFDGVSFEEQRSEQFNSANGEFVLEKVHPGTVALTASADGYAPQRMTGIAVGPGETIGGVEFRLSKGNVVRGTVIAASDSLPVAGATVYLGGVPGFSDEAQAVKVVTAANGSFELKDVPAGDQIVGAKHPDFTPASVPVVVRDGYETEVTIKLGSGGVVSGYVSENGVASAGAQMLLSSVARRFDQKSDKSDRNGYYEFKGLEAGAYRVIAVLSSRTGPTGREPLQGIVVEVEEGSVTEQDFDFRTGTGVIEGYITQNGEPVTDLNATVLGASQERSHIAGRSPVDATGFYRIEALAADSYRLSAIEHQTLEMGESGNRGWSSSRAVGVGEASVQLQDGETARVDIEVKEPEE